MKALNDTLQEVLLTLACMVDEPEFEYTKEELDHIAEMLINEEKDILEKNVTLRSTREFCMSIDLF